MFKPSKHSEPKRIGLFITPQFSMMAVLALFDSLRVANKLTGRRLFDYKIVAETGELVMAANGMSLMPDISIAEARDFPSVVVCSSYEPERYASKAVLSWLRKLARQGAELGAIDTGCHMLAAAGLLDGYRVTMHWETIPSFVEQFPKVQVTDELFEIDRDRFTCAGGTAGYDMMLHMIAQKYGNELAVAVAEQFIHNRIREPSEPQRMATALRLGTHHPLLIKVIQAMEQHIENPLGMGELAEVGGISRRQLDRLFQIHLRETPGRYYLKIRLRRARELLQQTSMSVLDIAVACGFVAPAHFSRAYGEHFGRSPRADRKIKSYFALHTRMQTDAPDSRASRRRQSRAA